MIIFGSSGRNSTVESGHFHCPRCGRDKPFDIISVRRYFTLYFIPLIPMGEAGRYLECKNCLGTFEEEAQFLDPEVENEKFKAEFTLALFRAMIVMAESDGPINARELDFIADMVTNLSGKAFEVEDVRDMAQKYGGGTMLEAFSEVREALSEDGRGTAIHALHEVAVADGRLVEEESNLLFDAGNVLGYRKKAIKQFLESADA